MATNKKKRLFEKTKTVSRLISVTLLTTKITNSTNNPKQPLHKQLLNIQILPLAGE